MVRLVVKETQQPKADSQQLNVIYVSQSQKEVITAIIKVLRESLDLPEQLVKSLLYKSIKLIMCGYDYGNCYKFEQNFGSKERRILYDKIKDQFLLLLSDIMTVPSEQRQIMLNLNEYFIPLIEEHYSDVQSSEQM